MTQIAAVTKISHHKHDWVALACQQAHWPNSTGPRISPGLGGSTRAWGLTQRHSPSPPQSSEGLREEGNACPTGQISFRFHDPTFTQPLFHVLPPQSGRFSPSPGWLALPPPQSVAKYVVTSLNLFPSFILTFLEPFFLNSWLLVSSWVFLSKQSKTGNSWKRLSQEQSETVARVALLSNYTTNLTQA